MQKQIETITEYLQTTKKHVCSILFDDAEGVQCTLKSVSLNAENTIIFTWEDDMMLDCTQDLESVLNSSFAHIFEVVAKEIETAISWKPAAKCDALLEVLSLCNFSFIYKNINGKLRDKMPLKRFEVETFSELETIETVGVKTKTVFVWDIDSITGTTEKELCFFCRLLEVESFDVFIDCFGDVVTEQRVNKEIALSQLGNEFAKEAKFDISAIPESIIKSFIPFLPTLIAFQKSEKEYKENRVGMREVSCSVNSKDLVTVLKKAETNVADFTGAFYKAVTIFPNGRWVAGGIGQASEGTINVSSYLGSVPLVLPIYIRSKGGIIENKLSDMLALLPAQPLNLKNEGAINERGQLFATNTLLIRSAFGQYEISLNNEFVDAADTMLENIRKMETVCSVEFQANDLRTVLNAATKFVSFDELRPAMCGVYFDIECGKMVATDAHKLLSYPIDFQVMFLEGKNTFGQKTNAILPLAEIRNFLASVPIIGTTPVVIHFKGACMEIVCGAACSTFKLIQGDYPDYKAVMPTKLTQKVSIIKKDLQRSLRLAKTYCNQTTKGLKLSFERGCMSIEAENLDFANKATEKLCCITEIDNFFIGVNCVFLSEVVDLVVDMEVEFEFTDSRNRAFVITDSKKTMLLMPIMLGDIEPTPEPKKVEVLVENTEIETIDIPTVEDVEFEDWSAEQVQQYEQNELGVE